MNNVWLHAKGKIWDAIIEKLKNEGYWKKVIKRAKKPSIDEWQRIKESFEMPERIIKKQESFYEKLIENRYALLDQLYRKTDWGTDRYNSLSFHELSNRIRIYYEFYSLVLLKENINLVIFWNSPHMGWDNILYEVAKSYNIQILILLQSLFPNKFFHYFDFYDFGTFETSKILGDIEKYEIEKKVEKDWYYMKKNNGQKSEISFKKLFNFSKYQNRVNQIIEKNDYLRLLRELSVRDRRSQSFFRFYTERNYKKELKNNITTEYSLENKYVYFPLHKQPEQVTSIWGGIYLDQVLAIERLSKIIPKDWFIYVKENPTQPGAYRDNLFFERLKLIPNLIFLSKKVNTFKLIKNAQFVATIIGTVGWEAITGGKNVLFFGWGTWYKNLPGAYEYSDDISINDIVNKKIDHESLQKKTGILYNKLGTGIVYDGSIPSITDFSMEKNTTTVVESLKKILY
jgi:hypothetical protein